MKKERTIEGEREKIVKKESTKERKRKIKKE
jgi:hypothetical protein